MVFVRVKACWTRKDVTKTLFGLAVYRGTTVADTQSHQLFINKILGLANCIAVIL